MIPDDEYDNPDAWGEWPDLDDDGYAYTEGDAWD